MNWFNTLARWVVLSSANPAEVSLTIRGVLVGLVPFIIAASSLANVDIGPDALSSFVDGLVNVVSAVLGAVSAIMIFFGMARKMWNTIKAHQNTVSTTAPTPEPAPEELP